MKGHNMITTKVKIKGQWRNVLGISTNALGELCYKVQCEDKKYFNKVSIYDPVIQDKVVKDNKRYPSGKKRYTELTEQEKENIKMRFHSGAWTLKEICDMFLITRLTVQKIVGTL